MRLLANENVLIATVVAPRDAGYDVTSLSETTPGIADEKALALAREQGRILVTLDRDYGNVVYGRGLPSLPGAVYLRFAPRTLTEPAEIVQTLLAHGAPAVEGHFPVVERDSFRRRPLPEPRDTT